MTRLGELLLQRGWISEMQRDAARQRQKQLGGRLGTALLEQGALAETLLLEALSEQLGVPAAGPHDLDDLKESVIRQLPSKIALRAEAVPFRSTSSRLDVAMLDVGNLALQDEMSFVVGKRVQVHIANEARIAEALHKYYGRQISTRFSHLIERLNREPQAPLAVPQAQPATAAVGAAPLVAAPVPERRLPRVDPKTRHRPHLIRLSPSERQALEARGGGRAATRSQRAAKLLREFSERLEAAERPTEVGTLLMDELCQLFQRVLLFNVRRRKVTGWMGRGPGVDRRRLRAFRVSLDEVSVFQEMESPGQPFGGALSPLPSHLRMMQIFGGAPGLPCLLTPVRVRQRLAAVIYTDRGGDEVEGVAVGLVLQLAARAGLGLERCILRRKADTTSR